MINTHTHHGRAGLEVSVEGELPRAISEAEEEMERLQAEQSDIGIYTSVYVLSTV